MGNKVGLSPVAVILALLVGASLFGLVGMLVAVPVAAVLNVFIGEAVEKYKASSLMSEKPEEVR
jgi:predicted PurR-regulated permease PerM